MQKEATTEDAEIPNNIIVYLLDTCCFVVDDEYIECGSVIIFPVEAMMKHMNLPVDSNRCHQRQQYNAAPEIVKEYVFGKQLFMRCLVPYNIEPVEPQALKQ